MDVKRVRSVASAVQASAGLRKDNSKEVWGKQEVRHEIGAESENAGTTAGSRGGDLALKRGSSLLEWEPVERTRDPEDTN